jgi:hypothetical protein
MPRWHQSGEVFVSAHALSYILDIAAAISTISYKRPAERSCSAGAAFTFDLRRIKQVKKRPSALRSNEVVGRNRRGKEAWFSEACCACSL